MNTREVDVWFLGQDVYLVGQTNITMCDIQVHISYITRQDIPSRYYYLIFWPYGHFWPFGFSIFLAVRFLFIQLPSFGLMDPPLFKNSEYY